MLNLINQCQAHTKAISTLKWSSDSKYLASASADKTVHIWNIDDNNSLTLHLVLSGHEKGISDVSWSPDNRLLATASDDCTIRIWSIATVNLISSNLYFYFYFIGRMYSSTHRSCRICILLCI